MILIHLYQPNTFPKASVGSCVENRLEGNRSGSRGPVRLPQLSRRETLEAWTWVVGVGVTEVESRSSTLFLVNRVRRWEKGQRREAFGQLAR